jgi:hypothetical protein
MFIVTVASGLRLVLPILQEDGYNSIQKGDYWPLTAACVGGMISACLLSPNNNNRIPQKVPKPCLHTTFFMKVAAVIVVITGQPLYGISALFIREMFYFGVAYKSRGGCPSQG